jgi:hypothetical protein
MDKTRQLCVIDAVEEVLRYAGHKARIGLHPQMSTGLFDRVAYNVPCAEVPPLGAAGQGHGCSASNHRLAVSSKDCDVIRASLERGLTAR